MATEQTAAATATASDATTPAGTAPDQSQPPTAAEVLQAGKEAAPEVIANQDAENAAAAAAATTPALVTEISPAPADPAATTTFELPQAIEHSIERVKEATQESELAAAHDFALVEHKIMDTISRCTCEVKSDVKHLRLRLSETLKHLACKLCGLPVESAVESQRS